MIDDQPRYCLGFVFRDLKDDPAVCLYVKEKGSMHAGMLNGLGGKIETTDLSPIAAMEREWAEESGWDTHFKSAPPVVRWRRAIDITFADSFSHVHVFGGVVQPKKNVRIGNPPSDRAKWVLIAHSCFPRTGGRGGLAPHTGWLIKYCLEAERLDLGCSQFVIGSERAYGG